MTTWSEYLEIDAVNISTLLQVAKSPAHYRHALESRSKDTAALRFGRIGHVAVLEPERYESEVVVWKGGPRRGREWEAWQEKHAGAIQVTMDEHLVCMAMQIAVRMHPAASKYMACGLSEHTVVWKHAGSGIQCKSRLDWVDLDNDVIVDLKTTRDASPLAFGRTAATYRYHTRAAFYCDAYETKYGKRPQFVLIAAEKTPPYAVAAYLLTDEQLDAGRREYEGLLATVKRCRENREWPGIADNKLTELLLPPWAMGPELDVVFDHEETANVG